ncbi:MAG: ATP-binding protein [Gemmatimonadaceae bacterium]
MRRSESLRNRLPLLISALLCVVAAVVCWSAYRQLKGVLTDATSRRLTSVTQQLSAMITPSVAPALVGTRQLAAESALALWVDRSPGVTTEDVTALLERRPGAATANAVAESVELWSRGGDRLLAVGPLASLPPATAPEERPATIPDSAGPPHAADAWVGRMVHTDSGVMSRTIAPVVRRVDGDTLALLVVSRRVAGTGVDQIRALIGSDATLMVGNTDASIWTDLADETSGPPTGLPVAELTEYTSADGRRWMGVATPIAQTPWLVWVQVPRAEVLAPARALVRDIALGALVIVALGAFVAWLISNRVTAPIIEISHAAEGVAGGDYSRRVSVARRDELGSLALSFNSMAIQVEAAAGELRAHALEMEAANDELRESELRYRQLVELSPDAIVVHRDLRILFANQSALALAGVSSLTELTGRSLLEFVPLDDVVGMEARAREVQEGRHALPFVERRLLRPDGTARAVESASTPFSHDGNDAVLSIFRDITERRRLEGRVRQSQKMEAVGQLAGGVAHDFNNLLTVIISYSGVVLSELPEGSPARADVQEIAEAGARAAALTRQLLAVSRQQVLQPQVLDLNEIIADMERMFRRVLPADIRIVTRLDPALGRTRADPGQLEQVLMNLAVNARDAMPDGGALLIETTNAELVDGDGQLHAGAGPGSYLLLTFSDTGCGMSAEQQRRAFDPFYTTKEPGQGTGLGLATVYGIVRQSGGHIGVYSEPDHGTVFRIYLPRVDAPAEPRTRRETDVTAGTRGAETILLVDDDAAVRAAARRILESAGYSVLIASDGIEALQLGARDGLVIDLLLTDMVMPDMSGRELSSRFREMHPGVATAFMSGYTEDVMLRQRVGPPGSVFIQKPFTPNSLTHALRGLLDGPTSAGATAGRE